MKNGVEYLYHITEPEYVQNILRRGLIRGGNGKKAMLYLCEDPGSWYKDGCSIIKVDMRNLPLNIEITHAYPELDEYLVWGDIEPTRVSDVTDLYLTSINKPK